MQATYSSYRDMKRIIRDISAIDIQRVIRGFIIRENINVDSGNSNNNKMSSLPLARQRSESTIGNGSNLTCEFIYSLILCIHLIRFFCNIILARSVETIDSSSSSLAGDSITKYRELQNQKKELKRLLKKFDEEFTVTNGRAPRKSDKEIMRPMYQQYHEVSSTYCVIVFFLICIYCS